MLPDRASPAVRPLCSMPAHRVQEGQSVLPLAFRPGSLKQLQRWAQRWPLASCLAAQSSCGHVISTGPRLCVWQPSCCRHGTGNTPQGCPGRLPSAPHVSSHAAASHRHWGALLGLWSGRPALHAVHSTLSPKRPGSSLQDGGKGCPPPGFIVLLKQPVTLNNRVPPTGHAASKPNHAALLRTSSLVSQRRALATAFACMAGVRCTHCQH